MTSSDRNHRLRYLTTNENLLAIRHGLDVKPHDNILAIAGGGDQAFSLLEFAGKVVILDSNPKQIQYVKRLVELLRKGDFLSFRKPGLLLQSDPELGFEVSLLEGMNDLGRDQ